MRRALVVAMLAAAPVTHAADVRVDQNNETGTEDGSAVRPYRSISAAVAAANEGDRVLVARGTYVGPVVVEAKTLTVMGGFAGALALEYAAFTPGDFSAANPQTNVTVVEGVATSAVFELVESGASRVEGFTIRGGGGASRDEFRSQGGGVYIDGGSPTIANNLIEDNTAIDAELESFGGGIFTGNANTTIDGNTIRSNRAARGAGITVSGGIVVIRGNTVEGNVAVGDHGGGIYAFSPDITIEDNEIFGNEIGRDLGYGWGGGIIVFNSGAFAMIRRNRIHHNFSPGAGSGVFIDEGASAVIEHCLIYANETNPDSGAGAVYVDPGPDDVGSTATIRHCTIWGHLTPEPTLGGNALFVSPFCTATVENSIMWGNDGSSVFGADPGSVTVSYSTTEEAVPGTGNRVGDPLFVNAAAGDFHLQSQAGHWSTATAGWVLDPVTSPAIDAANPLAPFELEPAGNGGRANQGFYGNTVEASRTTLPGPGSWTGLMIR